MVSRMGAWDDVDETSVDAGFYQVGRFVNYGRGLIYRLAGGGFSSAGATALREEEALEAFFMSAWATLHEPRYGRRFPIYTGAGN
jgi:hypothetical protein